MAFDIQFPLGIFHQKLDSGIVRSECLFFPEFLCLEASRERTREHIIAKLTPFVEELSHGELGRRRLATSGEIRKIEVQLDPPRSNRAWREPLILTFFALVWQHSEEIWLARIPDLDIEIISPKENDLEDKIQKEIVAALRRNEVSTSLDRLSWVQRTQKAVVEWSSLPVRLLSLKQIAQKITQQQESDKPQVLKQVAVHLNSIKLEAAYEVDDFLQPIADALTDRRPQSVLLVGAAGVGKTAIVRELVRQREKFGLSSTPFYQTSGSKLVAGMCGFGMWQERCRELCKELSRAKGILHLGNLIELMEVGKSEYNQIGIAGFLRPSIVRGEILCIGECTPEQQSLIERDAPQLLDAFRIIRIEEPNPEQTQSILSQFVHHLPYHLHRPIAPTIIETIDRLHRRYATYSACPGRPLRFLENLIQDSPKEHFIIDSDVLTAFTRETGLPRVLLDPAVPLSIEETRNWFTQRVIGQKEAVDLVVDLLATIKAGLTRPNRPIASLLFIGPTGVGKTEMAKALAEFLFGSRDRLTRFDMSEYADPIAVQRLAGGVFGSEGLLTSKIREQPFSVVLFDEFEKAHPAFFDLLLQVLGEARLTDAGGRLADFRNAVIILTSNLGAESYQLGGFGFADKVAQGMESYQAVKAKEHFVREVEAFLRPEMFNRLDRLVPFAPLGSETIRMIADREWQKVTSRDGIRFRGVQVDAAEEVRQHLAQKGFDVRYGARPLKRAIERKLLAPLAHQMNRYSADVSLLATIRYHQEDLEIEVKPRVDTGGRVILVSQANSAFADVVKDISALRRWFQILEGCSIVREMRNDLFQLERMEQDFFRRQRRKPDTKIRPDEIEGIAKLARLREVIREIQKLHKDIFDLEDSSMVQFYQQTEPSEVIHPVTSGIRTLEEYQQSLSVLNLDWDALLLRLYALNRPEVNAVTLVLYSEDRLALFELARAYVALSSQEGLTIGTSYEFVLPHHVPKPKEEPPSEEEVEKKKKKEIPALRWEKNFLIQKEEKQPERLILARRGIKDLKDFFKEPRAETLGIALRIEGKASYVRFVDERGAHSFFYAPSDSRAEFALVSVETTDDSVNDYLPPEGVTRRNFVGSGNTRRIYNHKANFIADTQLKLSVHWSADLQEILTDLLKLRMRAILQQMVLE